MTSRQIAAMLSTELKPTSVVVGGHPGRIPKFPLMDMDISGYCCCLP